MEGEEEDSTTSLDCLYTRASWTAGLCIDLICLQLEQRCLHLDSLLHHTTGVMDLLLMSDKVVLKVLMVSYIVITSVDNPVFISGKFILGKGPLKD